MTPGPADSSAPFDLSEVTRSGEAVDALSARSAVPAEHADDPAVRLLTALAADVDAGAPPLPAPARTTRGRKLSRRRSVRAFVAFGVASVVLTTAGAAAAGGGGRHAGGEDVARRPTSERSIASGGAGRPIRPGAASSTPRWPVRPSRPGTQFEPQAAPEPGSANDHGGTKASPKANAQVEPKDDHPQMAGQPESPHDDQPGKPDDPPAPDQPHTDSAGTGENPPTAPPESGTEPEQQGGRRGHHPHKR